MSALMKRISLVAILIFVFSGVSFAQNPRKTQAIIKTSAECQFCKKSIEKKLSSIKGVRKVNCDYQKHEIDVLFNSKKVSLNDIRKTLNEMGYDADDQPANNVKSNTIKHNK